MRITCVGDCGVDRYVSLGLDRPGGIALNLAIHAKPSFSSTDHVEVISAVGTDVESRIVLEAIENHDLRAHITRRQGSTSIQYIDLEPSGEKIFVRYEQGVLGGYRLGAEERRAVASSDLVVAPAYEEIQDFFDSVMEAPSSGWRAVDFLDLSDEGALDRVVRYIPRFHIGFFGLGASDRERIDRLEELARKHHRLFVVTLGPNGSLALGGENRLSCAAVPVPRVVDTTGAGDAFSAGFLAEYTDSKDVARSLRAGSQRAAAVIQHLGAF